MSATDILKVMLAPFREFVILAPLLMFWALIGFGVLGGPFGIFLLVLTLPALFRYVSFIVESYANGRPPAAFDAEFFNWQARCGRCFRCCSPSCSALRATAQPQPGEARARGS
jgi:hypothetical protein